MRQAASLPRLAFRSPGTMVASTSRLALRPGWSARRSLMDGPGGVREVMGGIDQRQMRECLWEIAELAPVVRVVFLGKQTDVVAQRPEAARTARAPRRIVPASHNCRPARSCKPGTRLLPAAGRRSALRCRSAARGHFARACVRLLQQCLGRAGRRAAESPPSGSAAGWRREPWRRTTEQRRSPPDQSRARILPDGLRRGRMRQRSSGPSRPNSSIERTARSNATQAITFEWVKCFRPPRTSQMPSSGSRHMVSRCETSANSSAQLAALVASPARRAA